MKALEERGAGRAGKITEAKNEQKEPGSDRLQKELTARTDNGPDGGKAYRAKSTVVEDRHTPKTAGPRNRQRRRKKVHKKNTSRLCR